jgi:hypothetical protein
LPSAPRIADAAAPFPNADAAFMRAYDTLARGADLLANGLRSASAGTGPSPTGGRYCARVIGNALRELDRFLNLLADEAARVGGLRVSPGQRNTANKLRDMAAIRLSHRDHARLRALGRSRECLFHCNGRVTRGDDRGGSTMTAGWPERRRPDAPLRRVPLNERLVVSIDDLADIRDFYRRRAFAFHRVAVPPLCPRSADQPGQRRVHLSCRRAINAA